MKLAFFWDNDYPPPNFLTDLFSKRNISFASSIIGLDGFFSYEKEQLYFSHVNSKMNKISFDWVTSWNYHKRQNYSVKKEPLFKALGMKGNSQRKVWDLTCGTGKDSLLMLFFGLEVVTFERSPIVSALVQDAHRRALLDDESGLGEVIKNKFTFYYGDPRNCLLDHSKPDVIFFDPMFPDKKKKSALPNKNMQIFKEVVGEDQDALDVFLWAKEQKAERLIVKRARNHPEIYPNPTASYTGKTTRYDMYCR